MSRAAGSGIAATAGSALLALAAGRPAASLAVEPQIYLCVSEPYSSGPPGQPAGSRAPGLS